MRTGPGGSVKALLGAKREDVALAAMRTGPRGPVKASNR